MSSGIFSYISRLFSWNSSNVCTKRYAKPLIRNPLAVMSLDESIDFHKRQPKVPILEHKSKKQFNIPHANDLRYTYLKDGDERFGQHISRIHKSRNKNAKNPKIVLEGVRLIADGINRNVAIRSIYFTKELLLNMIPMERLTSSTEFFKVSEKEMKIWSDTSHSSGLLAVANQPNVPALYNPPLPVKVILDGIKDEGHVGTLIRSAAAVGAEKVFVSSRTTDPWKPKVLRSAMGGHFHVPVALVNSHFLEGYASNASALYVIQLKENELFPITHQDDWKQRTSGQLKTTTCDQLKFKKNSVLMIGTEESQAFIGNLSEDVTCVIPSPYFDSFGTAVDGSVIMYEMKRQYDKL